VKSFAKMMIDDHSKMKKEKAELAKKLKLTPQPPANDPVPAAMTNEMSALNAAPTPVAFDSIYIADAVADHKNDLKEVKDLQTKVSSPELKDALKKAEPVVQKHLDHAKMIEAKLAKHTAAMKPGR